MRRFIRKIMEKMAEQGLSATARAVRNEHLTYLSNRKLSRLEQIMRVLDEQPIAGNYVEFGVALGGSAILIAKAAQSSQRTFTGFDVFGTIPPPESEKDDELSKQRYDVIVRGDSQGIGGDTYYGYRKDLYGDVVRSFSRHGIKVDDKAVALVQGLFQDTWPKRDIGPIAFAHLDCDWYDPVSYCLKVTAEKLVEGGIILLDDYHDYGGCRTATNEFLAQHPEFVLENGPNVSLRRKSPKK